MQRIETPQAPGRTLRPANPASEPFSVPPGPRTAAPPLPPPSFDAPAAETWIGTPVPPDPKGLRLVLLLERRYRALIVATVLLGIAVTVLRMLLQPPIYLGRATILPSGGQGQSSVLGLISSFTGAPPMLGGGDSGSSVLFPRILESRIVGLEVLEATYEFVQDGGRRQMTLFEYLGAEDVDEALRRLKMLRAIDVDKETGLIAVSVRTPYPDLSAQVANRCVEALEKYSLASRRSSASDQSTFVQERLARSFEELQAAEERLTTFRQHNLRVNDAQLELERLRLERDVTLRTQVYVTLNNQAEIARIEAAKDLPVVRVLDRAAVPTRPVPTPRLAMLAGGGILGVVMALLLVAGIEFLQYLRLQVRAL